MPNRPFKFPSSHVRAKKGEAALLVRGYIRDHPQATSYEIGKALNLSPAYVRAALRRMGLKLAGARDRVL